MICQMFSVYSYFVYKTENKNCFVFKTENKNGFAENITLIRENK